MIFLFKASQARLADVPALTYEKPVRINTNRPMRTCCADQAYPTCRLSYRSRTSFSIYFLPVRVLYPRRSRVAKVSEISNMPLTSRRHRCYGFCHVALSSKPPAFGSTVFIFEFVNPAGRSFYFTLPFFCAYFLPQNGQ